MTNPVGISNKPSYALDVIALLPAPIGADYAMATFCKKDGWDVDMEWYAQCDSTWADLFVIEVFEK